MVTTVCCFYLFISEFFSPGGVQTCADYDDVKLSAVVFDANDTNFRTFFAVYQ